MGEQRNVYPRHCRYCWAIIPDWEHDYANFDCGGCCADCMSTRYPLVAIPVDVPSDYNKVTWEEWEAYLASEVKR